MTLYPFTRAREMAAITAATRANFEQQHLCNPLASVLGPGHAVSCVGKPEGSAFTHSMSGFAQAAFCRAFETCDCGDGLGY